MPRWFALTAMLAVGSLLHAATIDFSGRTWTVRDQANSGPGPNTFSPQNVWTDSAGLHLQIARDASSDWTCAEVYLPASLGYGRYMFQVAADTTQLHPQAVLGLFTYADDTHEIDIESSRWGNASNSWNQQFVTQPYDRAGGNNIHRFTQGAGLGTVTCYFEWQPDRIFWQNYQGTSLVPPAVGSAATIGSYEYTSAMGSDIPTPGSERVHMNLWLYGGAASAAGNLTSQEVVIGSFTFTSIPEPALVLLIPAAGMLCLLRSMGRTGK